MNVANILATADAIEKASIAAFDMNNWVIDHDRFGIDENRCGTAACIAGHAYLLSGGQIGCRGFVTGNGVRPLARKFLGLNPFDASVLFIPSDYHEFALDEITAEHAVRCLRNLAITGKVDWIAAMKDDEPELPALPITTVKESA